MRTKYWNGMFGYDGKRRFILGYNHSGRIISWNEFTDQESAEQYGKLLRASGEYAKVRVVAKAKAQRLGKIDYRIEKEENK